VKGVERFLGRQFSLIADSDPNQSIHPAPPIRSQRWWIATAALLIVGAGATFFWWRNSIAQSRANLLNSQLTVLVRPPDRNIEPVSVMEPGADPVRNGGAMCLDARLKEPAYIYLIWIDAAGQTMPLYPWNNESLEIKDADEPPPERRATRLVFSPLLGRSWTIGSEPGLETVLLLTRRNPLPADVKLASLIALAKREPVLQRSSNSGSPKSEASNKSVTFIKMTRAKTDVSVIDDGKPQSDIVTYTEEPLVSILMHLKPHFDLIQAVQFAHVTGSTAPN